MVTAVARYKKTPKGRAANKRYRQSAKGKAAAARYRKTPEAKAIQKSAKAKARKARYRRSEKGRATQERYRAKLREKGGGSVVGSARRALFGFGTPGRFAQMLTDASWKRRCSPH
jgi:hypothetical protein